MALFKNGGCMIPTSSCRIKLNRYQLWTFIYLLLRIGSVIGEDKPNLGRFVGYSSLGSGSLDLIDLSSYAKKVPVEERSDDDQGTETDTKTTTEETDIQETTGEGDKSIEYLPFPYKELPVLVYEKKGEDTSDVQLSYQLKDPTTLSLGHHIYQLKDSDPNSDHHVFELKEPEVDKKEALESASTDEVPSSESLDSVVSSALVDNSTSLNDTDSSSSDVDETKVDSDETKVNDTAEDTKSTDSVSESIQPGSLVSLSHDSDDSGQMLLTAVGGDHAYQYGSASEGQATYYSDAIYGKAVDFDQTSTTASPISNEATPMHDTYQLSESQDQRQVSYQQVPGQSSYQTQLAYQPLDGQIAYQDANGQIYQGQVVYQNAQGQPVVYQNAQGQALRLQDTQQQGVEYQTPQGQTLEYQQPQGQAVTYQTAQDQIVQYQQIPGQAVQYQPSQGQQISYQLPHGYETAQGQLQYSRSPVQYQNFQGQIRYPTAAAQLQYQATHGQLQYQVGQQSPYQGSQSPVQYQPSQSSAQFSSGQLFSGSQDSIAYQPTEIGQTVTDQGTQDSQESAQSHVVYHDAHGDVVYQDENGQLSYEPPGKKKTKSAEQTAASLADLQSEQSEAIQQQTAFDAASGSSQVFVNDSPTQASRQDGQQFSVESVPGVQLYYTQSQDSQAFDPQSFKGFRYEMSNDETPRESIHVETEETTEEPQIVEIGRRYSEAPSSTTENPETETSEDSQTSEVSTSAPKISAKTDAQFERFVREQMGPQSSEQYQTFAAPPPGMLGGGPGFGHAESPFGGGFQGHFGFGGNLGQESAPRPFNGGGSSHRGIFGTSRPSFASMLENLAAQASTMNIRGGIFGGHRGESHQGMNPFQSGTSDSFAFGSSQLEPSANQFGLGMGGFTGFQGYNEDSLALGSDLGDGGREHGGQNGGDFGRFAENSGFGGGGYPSGQRDRYRHGIRHAHFDVNEQLATESQQRPIVQGWKPDQKPLEFNPEHKPLDWNPDQKPLHWKPDQKPLQWNQDQKPLQWNQDQKPLQWNQDQKPLQWNPDQKPLEFNQEHKPLGWNPDQKPVDWKPEQKPFGLVGYGNQAVSQAFTTNHRARPFKEIEDAIAFLKQIPPENLISPHRGQFLLRPEEPHFPKEIRNPLLEFVDKQIKDQFTKKPEEKPMMSTTPKPPPPPSPIPPPKAMPPPTTPKPPTYHIVHNIMHSIIHKDQMAAAAAQKQAQQSPIVQNGHVYRKKPGTPAAFGERIKLGQQANNVAINNQGAPIIIYQGVRPSVHTMKKPQLQTVTEKPKAMASQLSTNYYKPRPQALREQNGPALRATYGKVGSFDSGRSLPYYHRPVYPDGQKPAKQNAIESYLSRIPSRPLSRPSLRPPTRKPLMKPVGSSATTQKSTSYSTVFRYAGFEFPKYKVGGSNSSTAVKVTQYSPSLKTPESSKDTKTTGSSLTPTDSWTAGLYSHKSEYTPVSTPKTETASIGIRRSSLVTESFGGAGTWIPVSKPEESKYVKAVAAETGDKILYTPRNI